MGLFDGIEDAMQSPLFLAGANLALGGGHQGMMQGLQLGGQYRKQKRQQQAVESLFSDPEAQKSLGPIMPLLKAGGAEMLPHAAQFMAKNKDTAWEREKHAADERYRWAQHAEMKRLRDAQIRSLSAKEGLFDSRAAHVNEGAEFMRRLNSHGYQPRYVDDDAEPEAPQPQQQQSQQSTDRPPSLFGGFRDMRGLPPPNKLGGPMGGLFVGEKDPEAPMGVTAVPRAGSAGAPIELASGTQKRAMTQREIDEDILRKDPSLLSDTEKAFGVTLSQKAKQMKIDYLSKGRPAKVGHVWDLDERGQLFQPMVKEKETKKGDVPPEMIARTIRQLDKSMEVLGGTTDEGGNAKGDGPYWFTKGISYATGGRHRPEIFQAMNTAQEASMKAILALSGKSFSKFELENDLRLFKPLWSDNDEMSRFKMQAVKDIMLSLQEAKTSGLSEEEMRRKYYSAMDKAVDRLSGNKPPQSQSQPPRALPSPGGTSRGWSIQRAD